MGSPSIPKPPPAPPPPMTPVDQSVRDARRRHRRREIVGRQATMLTGPRGLVSRGNIATPTLLGGGL